MRRTVLLCLAALALPVSGFAKPAKPPKLPPVPKPLTVFAAASLTDALNDIGVLWKAQGHQIVFSYASSSTLAKQIDAGAPADIFASADEKWMDDVATGGHILPETRADVVTNSLVLVEPTAHLKPMKLGAGLNLAPVLGASGRLAVGDTDHVPAGIYARQALQNLDAWDAVKDHLAPAESVRAALRLVEIGEAPAGIVYATDVKGVPAVGIAGIFPPASHDPITYPFAAVKGGHVQDADAFLAFLHTEPAKDVFRHYGFTFP
jgi:molybdate transport system substrate-binding protein